MDYEGYRLASIRLRIPAHAKRSVLAQVGKGLGGPFGGLILAEGQHTLELEVFSVNNAHGTLLGDFEIDFMV